MFGYNIGGQQRLLDSVMTSLNTVRFHSVQVKPASRDSTPTSDLRKREIEHTVGFQMAHQNTPRRDNDTRYVNVRPEEI